MKNIGVIGSGSIGPDLAYGFASAVAGSGAAIILQDIAADQLEKGMARIEGYLKKGVSKGKLSPKKAELIRSSFKPTLDVSEMAECGYVMEAATENLSLKKKILAGIEAVVTPECLIGFATSGIPRKRIVEGAKHPNRCFVNHPFYPAWRSLPIEVVPSNDETATTQMMELMKRLGKVPILTADVACFAADDVFCNFECEAFRIVEDGVASVWQVDRIVNEHIGGGGPFRVADMTRGNPLIVHCQELMMEAHGGNKWFDAPDLLKQKVADIWRDPDNPGSGEYDDRTRDLVLDRMYAVLFARSFYLVDEGICDVSDMEWLLQNSLGFKQGVLAMAEQMGMGKVKAIVEGYAAGRPDFEVPDSIVGARFPDFMRHVVIEGPDEEGIATVLVRRPEAINALNARTIRELTTVFGQLSENEQVRGIVFGGYGGGIAGADIKELAALPDATACEAMCGPGQALTLQMEAMPVPVVAAIGGPVLGGGAELSMGAWARVVGKTAVIGQPEVNLGIIPGYGGSQRLPRLIGPERALPLLATGRAINAAQACEWGWATGEVTHDPFMAARDLLLDHIEGRLTLRPISPEPLGPVEASHIDIGHHSHAIHKILMEVVLKGLRESLSEGLKVEAEGFGRCRETQDMSIGMANFMQNGPRVPAVFVHI